MPTKFFFAFKNYHGEAAASNAGWPAEPLAIRIGENLSSLWSQGFPAAQIAGGMGGCKKKLTPVQDCGGIRVERKLNLS